MNLTCLKVYDFLTELAQSAKPSLIMTEQQLAVWVELQPYFEYTPYLKGCPTEIQHSMMVDNTIWTTQKGQKMRPEQMETRHILYSLRLLLTRIRKMELQRIEESHFFYFSGMSDNSDYLSLDNPYEDLNEDVLHLLCMYHKYHALYWEVDRRLKASAKYAEMNK